MGVPEKAPLEELGESAQALKQVCLEKGLDYERLLELTGKLAEAARFVMGGLFESFTLLKNTIAEIVSPIVADLNHSFNDILGTWDSELFWMVPPHIKHLAYNHPKARVRNKNWNRMWKIRERYMKNDKTESFPH